MNTILYTFAAGAVANCTVMLLGGQVLDRLKTQLQTNPALTTKVAFKKIFHEGPWNGLRWNMGQAGIKGATRWGINGLSDKINSHLIPNEYKKKYPGFFTLGIALTSAVIDATVTNVTDRAKTFEMSARDKKETIKAIQARGIRFFFDGWSRTCVKQIAIWGSYQTTYGYLKRSIVGEQGQNKTITIWEKFALGVIPGMASAVVSTVPDLIKTQAQKVDPLHKNYFQTVSFILREHGWKGLGNSLGTKVVRSGYYSLVTFIIMDQLQALPNNMQLKK